jgi:hypothetical protein
MATFEPTKRDLKKFEADIARNPGKTYYSIAETAAQWNGQKAYCYEITFKKSRFLGLCSWGHLSPAGTHANYGPITDVKPDDADLMVEQPDEKAEDATPEKVAVGTR